MKEYSIIYYFYNILEIGGIETFFYQLAKKYHDRDLTIIYRTGNEKQIERLKKYVNVFQYDGSIIKCKQAFFNFNLDIINNVQAEEYILVIHGDYKDMVERNQISTPPDHPKLTRRIAVSKLAAKSYEELTGKKVEVCYNPYQKLEEEKPLLLFSATRLSQEKGFSRMKILAEELERQKIDYFWLIFTNSPQEYISQNVIYLSPRIDIEKFIELFDYTIQLSDNEGYCYTIVESLSHGVPVICTPCPVFKELNIDDKNSIRLEFDCSNVEEVVKKMKKKRFDFKYTPKKDNWKNILLNIKSDYYEERNKLYLIEATDKYEKERTTDKELSIIPGKGKRWITNSDRAKMLKEKGYVKIVKEVKNETNDNNCSI